MVGYYFFYGGGVVRYFDNFVREFRKCYEVYVFIYGFVKVREFEREFVY